MSYIMTHAPPQLPRAYQRQSPAYNAAIRKAARRKLTQITARICYSPFPVGVPKRASQTSVADSTHDLKQISQRPSQVWDAERIRFTGGYVDHVIKATEMSRKI
ncbi:hypothetical protein J6590_008708 [Homalodisca vitripennis]|nr:hypothetical protein J6590_008708 [Homalodisca vitripennis]